MGYVGLILTQMDFHQIEENAEGNFPLQKLNFDELALYKSWRSASILRALYYFLLVASVITWLIYVSQNPETGGNGLNSFFFVTRSYFFGN